MDNLRAEDIGNLAYLGRSAEGVDCNVLTLANGAQERNIDMQRFERLWKIKVGTTFEAEGFRRLDANLLDKIIGLQRKRHQMANGKALRILKMACFTGVAEPLKEYLCLC